MLAMPPPGDLIVFDYISAAGLCIVLVSNLAEAFSGIRVSSVGLACYIAFALYRSIS